MNDNLPLDECPNCGGEVDMDSLGLYFCLDSGCGWREESTEEEVRPFDVDADEPIPTDEDEEEEESNE